jgi:hypothetical protein
VTKYQFEVSEEEWNRWKLTVPRDKSLDERIRELLEADADGRVLPAGQTGGDQEAAQPVADAGPVDVDVPGDGQTAEQRREAVRAVYERLQETGRASKADLLALAVPIAGETYSSERSLWKNLLQPALSSIEGVEPVGGSGDWRFVEN